MNPKFVRVIGWVTTLIIPFFLLMTVIRILFSPLFFQVEYRRPGFPPDMYGFTMEDRLHWGRVSLDYLLNDEGIEYLADQRLPNGDPLYNERELSHMLDVKILLQRMILVWGMLFGLLILIGSWAWRGDWLREWVHALGRGGRLTIGLILFILAAVAISFRALFTAFHRIFFQGDTWLFNYSDTLIRLFPMDLWRDGFIMMGTLTLLGAAALILLEWRVSKRKQV